MLDFSYKKPVLLEMAKQAITITIIDHHKSAKEDLEELFTLELSNITGVFDVEHSGAWLSWKWFHEEDRLGYVPMIVRLVEDRDLWKFKYKETKAFSAYLFSLPYNFDTW